VDLLEAAEEQLKSAQDELAAAQVAATEAVARREEAESGLRKLEAAVAALRGEPPPAKELEEQNPLAHVKCSGCGTKGSLAESYIQSPAGTPVRTLVCGKCNNQSF
jgi:chromosome segregation ATPase